MITPNKEQQLIRIWDRKTLKLVHAYKGHDSQISKLIFLKAEKIASASHDSTIRIWNLDNFDQDK